VVTDSEGEKPVVSQGREGRQIFAYGDLSVKNKKPRDPVKDAGTHEDNICLKLFRVQTENCSCNYVNFKLPLSARSEPIVVLKEPCEMANYCRPLHIAILLQNHITQGI
jgi:hypothetical protein